MFSTVDPALSAGRSFQNFKPSNTRKIRNALSKIRAGTGSGAIASHGDSTGAGTGANTGTLGQAGAKAYSFPTILAAILNKNLCTAQESSTWGTNNIAGVSTNSYDSRVTLGAGWAGGSSSITPLFLNNTNTNLLSFTPTQAFDTIDVYYVQNTSAATFTVDIDGGAALATIIAAGTAAYLKQTVSCAHGTHTINLTKASAAALNIGAIVVSDSTAPALLIHNWGYHGASSATNWGANAWSLPNAIATAAPDCLLYGMGINDLPSFNAATFKTNAATILTTVVTAGGDPWLLVPDPVQIDGTHALADQLALRQAYYDLMATYDCPLIDRYSFLESYAQLNTNGWQYDNLHLNKFGYANVAELIARAVATQIG